MLDPETLALLRDAGPVAIGVAVSLVLWLETRLRPPFLRGLASHMAASRKLGVTDDDVAQELAQLKAAPRG